MGVDDFPLIRLVRLAHHHFVAGIIGDILNPADGGGEKVPDNIGHDHPYDIGFLPQQVDG